MNYGIGKMRPCGHSHIYKYNYVTTRNGLAKVNRDHGHDTNEGEWTYKLDNMENLQWAAFAAHSYQGGGGFSLNKYSVKKFVVSMPKLNYAAHVFTGVTTFEHLELTVDKVGGDYILAPGIHMGTRKRIIYLKYPNFTGSVYASFMHTNFSSGSDVRIYAPKATNATEFFVKSNINETIANVEIFIPSITIGTNAFNGSQMTELTHKVYPISGNNTFGQEPTAEDLANVDENGEIITEKRYSLFPKLTTAQNFFPTARLKKDYLLKLIYGYDDIDDENYGGLKTYTDGRANHPLSLGIHINHIYDDELTLALKSLDNDYVTYLELGGRTITPTENKGWSLSVAYNGTLTDENITGSDEPILRAWIDDDSIVLPAGYRRCEYLEDTGTQWIDTGYVPQVVANSDGTYTATTGLYAVAKQITAAGHVHYFGSGSTEFIAPTWLKAAVSGCGFAWNGWTGWGWIGNGSAFESKLNFLQSGTANLLTNYGYSRSSTLAANLGLIPTLSLYLFSTNVNNTSNRRWKGRIYRAKISEGTEIVRDFVPCLDADGVPCMYDVLESNGSVEADTYYNANEDSTFLYKLL